MPIGDPEPAAVDEACESSVGSEQIWQTSISMRNHKVLVIWLSDKKLLEEIGRWATAALFVKISFVNEPGPRACVSPDDPAIDSVVERTICNIQVM